jgi:AcrR family transcriptional regulator
MGDSDGGTARERLSRRASVLRALAQETGTGPGAPARAEALRYFGSERELLLAVHQRWQVNLLTRLDQVLENGADDVHDDVLRAVEAQSRSLPGFAALLREHGDDQVLDAARRRLAGYLGQACPCARPHPLVAPGRAGASTVTRLADAVAAGVRHELAGFRAAIRRSTGHCRIRCAARRASPRSGLVPGRP